MAPVGDNDALQHGEPGHVHDPRDELRGCVRQQERVGLTVPQASIDTGVPRGTALAIWRMTSLNTRMQPFDTFWPTVFV